MYDWAASSMQTTVMVAVFPIYFVKVAGKGLVESGATQRLATVNTIALLVIALALADTRRGLGLRGDQEALGRHLHVPRRRGGGRDSSSSTPAISSSPPCSLPSRSIGVAGSFVFYESLLPHIARPNEIDRVSTAGYAMGYVGGGILLALNLAWIQKPEWFGLPPGRA